MGFDAVPSIILRNSCVAALPCEATYVSFVPSGEKAERRVRLAIELTLGRQSDRHTSNW
jgi:hypothetical protein